MGLKMKAGITWSTLELSGLLEDEDSRVFFERTKRHLGLHPFHLTDLNAALREILSSSLNKYDPELKGIILSYRNPRLPNCLGEILYDACYVHVDIEADFYVFRPEVACNLRGIVNKKSEDHVGVLVHKAFNVSIPKPEDDDDWPGNKVNVGQEVKFTVSFFDFKGRLPYIRGVFDPDDYLQGCKIFDPRVNIVPEIETGPTKKKFQDVAAPRQNKRTVFNSDNEEDAQEQVSPKKKLKASKSKKNQTIDSDVDASDIEPPKKQTKRSKALASELKSSDSKSKPKKSKKKSTSSGEVKEKEEETKASIKKVSKNLSLSSITGNETSDVEEDSRHVQLKKSIKKSKMSKHQMSDSESEVERKPLSKRQSKKSKTSNSVTAEMSDEDRKPSILTPVTSQDSEIGGDEESSSRSRKKPLMKLKTDDTGKSSKIRKYESSQDSDTEGNDSSALKSLSKKQSKKSKNKDSEIVIKSEIESESSILNSITKQDSDSEEKTSIHIPSPKKSMKMSKNTENIASPKKQMKKSKSINKTSFTASDRERDEEAVPVSSPKKSLKKSKNEKTDASISSDTDTKQRIYKFLTSRESDTEKDKMPPPPESSPKKQLKKSKVINRIASSESESDAVAGPKSSPRKSFKKSKNTNSNKSSSSDIDNKFKNLIFMTKPNRNEKLIETSQSKASTKKSTKNSKKSISQNSKSEQEEIPEEKVFAVKMSSQSQSQESSTETDTNTNFKKVKNPRGKKTTIKTEEKQKATDSSISKNLSTSSKSAKSSKKSVTDAEELKQVESTKEHKEKVDVLKGTKRKKKQSISEDLDSIKEEPEVKESLKKLPKEKKIKTDDSDSAVKESPLKKSKTSFFKNGDIINSTPYSFAQQRKTLSRTESKKNVVEHSDSDSETDENESLNWRKFDQRSKKTKSQNNEIDNYEKSLEQRIGRSSFSLDDSDAEPNGTATPDKFLESLASIKKEPTENEVQFKRQESTPPRNKSSSRLSSPSKVIKRKRKNTIADNDFTDNETSEKDESDISKSKRIKVEATDSCEEKSSPKKDTPSTYETATKDSPKKNRTPKQSSSRVLENSKIRKKKTKKSSDDDTDNEKDKVMNSVQKNRRILDSSEDENNSTDGSAASPKNKMAYGRNTSRFNDQDSSMEEEKFYLTMNIKQEPL